jgi:flagellar motor protein MotB
VQRLGGKQMYDAGPRTNSNDSEDGRARNRRVELVKHP